MNTTSRQLQKDKTLYSSEVAKRAIKEAGLRPRAMSRWAGLNIVRLLNQKPNSATVRITWMVEACQRVIQLDESMKNSTTLGPNKEALLTEISVIMKELNERLFRYKCLPVVMYLAAPDRYFEIQYQFVVTNDTASEGVAVGWLMDHIDTVHRIRRCHFLKCRKWFFAVTDHQKYCGDTCRKRDASQGESFKEKRRNYMKKYRIDEAERDKKQSY